MYYDIKKKINILSDDLIGSLLHVDINIKCVKGDGLKMSHVHNVANQSNEYQQAGMSDKMIWLFTPLMNNAFADTEELWNQEDTDLDETQRVEEELEYLNSWERMLEII